LTSFHPPLTTVSPSSHTHRPSLRSSSSLSSSTHPALLICPCVPSHNPFVVCDVLRCTTVSNIPIPLPPMSSAFQASCFLVDSERPNKQNLKFHKFLRIHFCRHISSESCGKLLQMNCSWPNFFEFISVDTMLQFEPCSQMSSESFTIATMFVIQQSTFLNSEFVQFVRSVFELSVYIQT
jgi:hypothetical protein